MMENLNHLALIPDGNRRWAKLQNKNPWDGHTEGVKRFWDIAEAAHDLGIPHVTFWAASYGNITKRTKLEVNFLFQLIRTEVSKPELVKRLTEKQVRFQVLGEWRTIIEDHALIKSIDKVMEATQQFTEKVLTILFVYDGQREMLEAVNKLIPQGQPVNNEQLKSALLTSLLPDVDFVIRTGGEPHWSAGFLMWQTANSQFYFTKALWPDFKKPLLMEALADYAGRERRLGK